MILSSKWKSKLIYFFFCNQLDLFYQAFKAHIEKKNKQTYVFSIEHSYYHFFIKVMLCTTIMCVRIKKNVCSENDAAKLFQIARNYAIRVIGHLKLYRLRT